jgi:TPR repeat protein
LWQKIVAARPTEYTAIFEIGFVYQSRGDLKGYMEQMIKAGNLGMLEAQNNIGYYYMVGQRGLPRDLYEARNWLTLSANQGFEHAREKVKLVNEMIAKEQGNKVPGK